MDYKIVPVFLVCVYFRSARSWHQFSNTDYHCWPLSANDANPEAYESCPGVDITWIEEPPSVIEEQAEFNTTTQLFLEPSFYSWAVGKNIFENANGSVGISDASLAKEWCESTSCPSPSDATQENCCIHHMNIHSCPMDTEDGPLDVCGPWIPPNGQVFTHSKVIVGPVSKGNWTNTVSGLYVLGRTSIIAHFKVADISIALIKFVKVLPKTVCGDSICGGDETCENCNADCGSCPLKTWAIAIITLCVISIAMLFASLLLKLQYQKRKFLLDESWIYQYDSIVQEMEPYHAFGSCISRRSTTGHGLDDGFSIAGSLNGGYKQVFATTGILDGKTVTIRKVNKLHFTLTRKIREEVRIIRSMDHINLCKFLGGCIKVPNVCILMEYCPKGSLIDVLLNDDIPLSWSFRLSFSTDIARGMTYLHGHDMVHSRLKSHNCVIDDRWTVKITDYGLPVFRFNDFDDEGVNRQMKERQDMVYLAPERRQTKLAKEVPQIPCQPTFESDVYAFAIILVEIATRNEADADEDCSSLPADWKPLLPTFGEYESSENKCPCPDQYVNLIVSCWNTNVKERPRFDVIKRLLHKMNPNKLNPVDLMMSMMEKYSKHLESLVTDRTKELILEKQKTDRLLYSMLPKTVADELRYGRPVQAENYEICTILFSDIVGFTSLSSASTPIEVVTLLNKLYITFDEIIEKFDVYKVETIGDAYMVVSGVPNPTDFHASEIAKMALEIVEESKIFVIPHRQKENIKIRVGLHSGHVCAGVVGLTMPRYCLFGDTVNTASRMESNGEAYRIHISDATHTELMKQDGFQCEERGTIPIKGKGDMKTWWLIGHSKEKRNKISKETLISADQDNNEININLNTNDDSNITKKKIQKESLDGCIELLKNLNNKSNNNTTVTEQKAVRFE